MNPPSSQSYRPFLHALAISTVLVAMVTLIFGALTTTKNAGMAFRDWPTSDGHFMVTYPWFQDFASNWGKFLEHGHRLAGMLIGMWVIALMIATFASDRRWMIRSLSVTILIGVILQGLLGGFRVQLNERGLAMLHGIFAAVVVSLMGTMICATVKQWFKVDSLRSRQQLGTLKAMAIFCVVSLVLQYVYGSLIRHKGTGLHEHLGLGLLMLMILTGNAFVALRSDVSWIRWSGIALLLVGFGQVGLGLATWVLKYGFAYTGYVAVVDSVQQVTIRTAHMVWGVITLMTAVVHLVKVFRVSQVSAQPAPQSQGVARQTPGKLQVGGVQ
ncbi:COX15/CtaA family protein [Planctomicrobium sp. SH668]|uniref:COX15/CtaA family protein n=1 Tax=Planctomicrobium sp. SH668 TaxID=3448126 RepID=UPI003F5B29E6